MSRIARLRSGRSLCSRRVVVAAVRVVVRVAARVVPVGVAAVIEVEVAVAVPGVVVGDMVLLFVVDRGDRACEGVTKNGPWTTNVVSVSQVSVVCFFC